MVRPKILMFISTRILGGPGKGLVQFFESGGLDIADVEVGVDSQDGNEETEFHTSIRETGVHVETFLQKHVYDPTLLYRSYRYVKDNGFNILESNEYKSHVICFFLKLFTGLPWVAYAHGWTTENVKVKLYHSLDKILLPRADTVVAVSKSVRERLAPKAAERAVVIYNAIEPVDEDAAEAVDVREQFGVQPDETLLTVVGRLSPEKGHKDFIEALPMVLEKHPKVRAMLVGDGPDREKLEQRVADAGLEDVVIFTGYQGSMPPFYAATDLLVMPSLSEGLPYVALEGMSYGLPMVTTDVGGIPELVQEGVTGYLTPSEQPEAFARAIRRMLDDPEAMKRMGEAGRNITLNHFTPEVRVKQLEALYSKLLESDR